MFREAYKLASQFTKPVIVSTRLFDKSVECMLGAFVILNDEGWIATVAHILQPQSDFDKHTRELNNYNQQVQTINSNTSINEKNKINRISQLKFNPKWITNISYWWAKHIITDFIILPEADLAIGKIQNYDRNFISTYPLIKDPNNLDQGTSLCKLGFPFHNPHSTFDETTGQFQLQPGTLPVPRFPIEGIFTRNADVGKSKDGKFDIRFLETSSPGLKGQSGGAIFDVKGTVWAIQSHTRHLPLGFSPKIMINGKEVEENQFLNIGMGVHPSTLVAFLKDNKVNFKLSDY